MYAYAYSMTKVISLSNEAYSKIKAIKKPGESFSDIVIKLVNKTKKKPLIEFFGKWPGPESEIENIKKTLEEGRKNFKTREVIF